MGQRDYQYFMSSRKNRFVVNVIYPAQINLMASFAKSSSNLFILVEHICILILAFSYIPTYHFFISYIQLMLNQQAFLCPGF